MKNMENECIIIEIDKELLKLIDEDRKELSRDEYINKILEKYL